MKRLLNLIVALSCFMLTSCEINLGKTSFEVHWLVIAIPVILIFVIAGITMSKTKYVCPNCNKTFYTKWWKCIFTTHFDNGRALKCPHCHKTDVCYPSFNQEKENTDD